MGAGEVEYNYDTHVVVRYDNAGIPIRALEWRTLGSWTATPIQLWKQLRLFK